MSKIYDVIVLGAGPAGLTAGLYAGRSRLSTLIIEKGQDGGQIAITNEIENYPGQQLEGESGPDAVLAGEVLFWPKGFSLMGYEAVFQHSELWQSYLNSIIYTVLGSALSVIVSLAAAYALSRKFAGKAFVNFLITFTMFFSGGLIPIFLNVRD